jgi:hypothetical protein
VCVFVRGRYDGALGILVALAAVKGMLLTELVQRNMTDRLPPQHIEEARAAPLHDSPVTLVRSLTVA